METNQTNKLNEMNKPNNTNDINNRNDTNKHNETNNISVLESVKTNYLSWIFIILSVIIISYPSIKSGFITFFIFLLLSYYLHVVSHNNKNIFTIIHHYHHDNNNFFSHFSQILFELSLLGILIPLHIIDTYIGNNYIDIWSGGLYALFYSTVHNYNYGQLRVNDVHYLHHKNIFMNYGPDICDITFNTKHPDNKEVENTNHYIPNIILSSIFVLFLKYLCNYENIKTNLLNIYFIIMILIILFLAISSIYLYVNIDTKIYVK